MARLAEEFETVELAEIAPVTSYSPLPDWAKVCIDQVKQVKVKKVSISRFIEINYIIVRKYRKIFALMQVLISSNKFIICVLS
jgi:hypothetical protein